MSQRTETEETAAESSIVPSLPLAAASQQEAILAQHAEETAELIASVEVGIARRKRRIAPARYLCVMNYAVGFLLLMGLYRLLYRKAFPLLAVCWVCIQTAVNALSTTIRIRWAEFERPEEHIAIRRLVAMDDPGLTGVLIDALYWTDDQPLQDLLRQNLNRLLPMLTEAQICALGRKRHGILAVWMQRWNQDDAGKDPTLLLEILHALAANGRGHVETETRSGRKVTINLLPILQPWILGKRAGIDPTVRKAAIACRDAILRHQATPKSGEQLLRASVAPASRTEDLLHPVQGVSETDPRELLRPDNASHQPPKE